MSIQQDGIETHGSTMQVQGSQVLPLQYNGPHQMRLSSADVIIRAGLSETPGWIQCWALILGMYEYHLGFWSSTSHGDADALSRLPLPQAPEPSELVLLKDEVNDAPVSTRNIMRETIRDPFLSRVFQFVLSGWAEECDVAKISLFGAGERSYQCNRGVACWGTI